jgi:hypothetical protein
LQRRGTCNAARALHAGVARRHFGGFSDARGWRSRCQGRAVMKTTSCLLLTTLGAFSLSILGGCAVDPGAPDGASEDTSGLTTTSTAAGTTAVANDDVYAMRAGQPTQQLVASGAGWQQLHVTGSVLNEADDGTASNVDQELVVVDSPAALASAPIPATAKQQIQSQLAALPAAERDGTIIVNMAAARQIEIQATQPQNNVAYFWPSCDDVDKTWTKSFSKSKTFSYAQADETGSFQGNVNIAGSANGQVTASVTVRLDKKWIPIAGCTTFWGHVKRAQLTGRADVTGSAVVNGKFQKEWHESKNVANPTIYDDWVSIGGLPVKVKVTLPIDVGIDASAQVDFHADVGVEGHGTFDVTCTSSSCSATKNATWSWKDNKAPTLGLSARAKVSPWVQPNVKLDLYYGAATGQIGLRATLNNDLWAYFGNTCGDSNNDGSPEWVQAATLDARLALDLKAKVGFFGSTKDWSWNLVDYHVGFFDLIGSTAMDPIFYVSKRSGTSYTFSGRMRPCWPYTQAMKYRIDWSDGSSTEEVSSAPGTLFTKTHNFTGMFVSHPVKVTAVVDTAGHDPNRTTTRSVRPTPIIYGGAKLDRVDL